ncbi:MAG: protein phosphatase 2C domain-containing protein [Bdellovibrionales bacterium]|nr:protein phosphatase 2C domain-containing protein [Bdellovibrionales bacterium]
MAHGVRAMESVKQSLVLAAENMEAAAAYVLAAGAAVVFSCPRPGEPERNEDAAAVVVVDEHTCALIVADGLGSTRNAADAARLAVEAVRRSIEQARPHELRSAILDGFEQANRAVLALGVGAATTLSVMEVGPDGARGYHVGDSLILAVGQRGKIRFQNIAHSPVGYAVEAGVLSERQAMEHDERHIVSNVVGSSEMRIELGPTVQLAPRDTILVASDGLSDNLRINEIVETIRKGPLPQAGQALITRCESRMNDDSGAHPSKPDDLTFVLYRR